MSEIRRVKSRPARPAWKSTVGDTSGQRALVWESGEGQKAPSQQLQRNRQIISLRAHSCGCKVETSSTVCPGASDGDSNGASPGHLLSLCPLSCLIQSPGASEAAGSQGLTFKFILLQKMPLDQVKSGAHP